MKVYKSYKDCTSNSNELLKKESAITTIEEEDYKTIEDNLNTLKYTLINTDGIYKITSIK